MAKRSCSTLPGFVLFHLYVGNPILQSLAIDRMCMAALGTSIWQKCKADQSMSPSPIIRLLLLLCGISDLKLLRAGTRQLQSTSFTDSIMQMTEW